MLKVRVDVPCHQRPKGRRILFCIRISGRIQCGLFKAASCRKTVLFLHLLAAALFSPRSAGPSCHSLQQEVAKQGVPEIRSDHVCVTCPSILEKARPKHTAPTIADDRTKSQEKPSQNKPVLLLSQINTASSSPASRWRKFL